VNITLQGLRAFEATARTGSATLAADELGLSASTVSDHLDNLDAAVGADLFARHPSGGRRANLVRPEGARLLPLVRRILGDIAECRAVVAGALPTPRKAPPVRTTRAELLSFERLVPSGEGGWAPVGLTTVRVDDVSAVHQHDEDEGRVDILVNEDWMIARLDTELTARLVTLGFITLGGVFG
jgi:DNA-binding transcriptional LysR family regulator